MKFTLKTINLNPHEICAKKFSNDTVVYLTSFYFSLPMSYQYSSVYPFANIHIHSVATLAYNYNS